MKYVFPFTPKCAVYNNACLTELRTELETYQSALIKGAKSLE
jgi:hypothetical protein